MFTTPEKYASRNDMRTSDAVKSPEPSTYAVVPAACMSSDTTPKRSDAVMSAPCMCRRGDPHPSRSSAAPTILLLDWPRSRQCCAVMGSNKSKCTSCLYDVVVYDCWMGVHVAPLLGEYSHLLVPAVPVWASPAWVSMYVRVTGSGKDKTRVFSVCPDRRMAVAGLSSVSAVGSSHVFWGVDGNDADALNCQPPTTPCVPPHCGHRRCIKSLACARNGASVTATRVSATAYVPGCMSNTKACTSKLGPSSQPFDRTSTCTARATSPTPGSAKRAPWCTSKWFKSSGVSAGHGVPTYDVLLGLRNSKDVLRASPMVRKMVPADPKHVYDVEPSPLASTISAMCGDTVRASMATRPPAPPPGSSVHDDAEPPPSASMTSVVRYDDSVLVVMRTVPPAPPPPTTVPSVYELAPLDVRARVTSSSTPDDAVMLMKPPPAPGNPARWPGYVSSSQW